MKKPYLTPENVEHNQLVAKLEGLLDRRYAEGRTDLIENAMRCVEVFVKRHDARARKKWLRERDQKGKRPLKGWPKGLM
jgi:hypothetical protein